MKQGRRMAPLLGAVLLLLILWARSCIPLNAQESDGHGNKKFGDKCGQTQECGFDGSVCDDLTRKCLCRPELPVTNHLDRCGVAVRVDESCTFSEQCEAENNQTECKEGICKCRFEIHPVVRPDGRVDCENRGNKIYGDKCGQTKECGFDGSVCDDMTHKCLCRPELPVTNHLDRCGVAVRIDESCTFNAQCEAVNYQTECKEGICKCRFEKLPVVRPDGRVDCENRGNKKFGDKCGQTKECGFDGSVCDDKTHKCLCRPELPVTNHLDRCGVAVRVNESCTFSAQCEAVNYQTECKEGICICRFDKQPVVRPDGRVDCEIVQRKYYPEKYIDPAMIGILVAMFLMFITICVVLRLFSKARWRENRTIFNTPNPRLMNVSLLKENKHPDRRGSRTSRGPSRQPSMVSLRAQSPNSQGSRRGSRGSSNISAASTRSNKSPPQANNPAATPMLGSVTVEIQEPRA